MPSGRRVVGQQPDQNEAGLCVTAGGTLTGHDFLAGLVGKPNTGTSSPSGTGY